jgi:16S rRNA (guanine527-N7)-methyltransferase
MASLSDSADLWQHTLTWQPTSHQQAQFQRLYDRVLDGNRYLNLTRITDPEDFWEKHLWDSLRGVQEILVSETHNCRGWEDIENARESEDGAAGRRCAIDIGTGAGFPGLPIAIALPDWQITLLDSTRKKVDFIRQILPDLPLTNTILLTGRVEDLGQQRPHREHYDLATLRAVSAAAVCAEYALPLVKIGGYAILYRGHWTTEETDQLQLAAEQLGGTVESVESFKTPITHGDRHCLYLRKVSPTPTLYPRSVGLPTQNPLS